MQLKVCKSGIDFVDSKSFTKFLEETAVKSIAPERPERYDVIHLNSYDLTINMFLKAKVPKIFVLHGSPDCADETACRAIEDLSSKVDALVVVSAHAARKLNEMCGIKPDFVINHGVDVEIFNPVAYPKSLAKKRLGIPAQKKAILWNARLSPEKRLETLIYALPRVAREVGNVIVLVKTRAINKSYEAKILRLIKKLRVDKYVIFDRDWTPLIHMPVYYRAADVYVNTSTTEAFGSLTMLEAMACGTPTIANNASSNPEALGNGGLLYDNCDPSDLAEKLLRVLNDDKLAKLLSRKAFERVSRELTLYQTAKKYIELYSSL